MDFAQTEAAIAATIVNKCVMHVLSSMICICKKAPCPPDPIPKHQATQVTHSGLLFVACLCVTVTDLRDFPSFGSSPASGLTHFIIQSSSNVSQSHTEGIYCTTHNFSIAFRETSGEPGPMVHWQKKVVT